MKKEKPKRERLPRGIHRRKKSLIVCFADDTGRVRYRSLGPVGVAFAKQQREIFKRQVAEGTYEGKKPRPSSFTVASLFPLYMQDFRNRGGRSGKTWDLAWTVHLKVPFGPLRTGDLTTAKISDYIAERKQSGAANGTVNRELCLLKAMLHFGAKQTPPMVDRLPAFPSALKESSPRQGFIGDKEYSLLASNCKDLWLRALIAVAYTYGFRKGEVLGLRVGQVDFLGKWIDLKEGETKSGEPRKVKMSNEVYELMKACARGKGGPDYVFTRKNGARVIDPRDEWAQLCVKSGLGQWVPAKRKNGEEFKAYRGLMLHDFRRSAIRNMVRRGISETVAMRISGHKTASVFRRYNIVDEADLEQATKLIEAGRSISKVAKSRAKTERKTYTSTLRVS